MAQSNSSRPSLLSELKQIIATEIKFDDSHRKRNKVILGDTLDCLISKMKHDKLFNQLYQDRYYTGSSYENLRIIEPNEFDINIILKLPFPQAGRKVEYDNHPPSFAKYKLKQSVSQQLMNSHKDTYMKLEKWFDSELFLLPEKVLEELQSLLDRFLINLGNIPNVKKITQRRAGPARTMLIETVYDETISVDLVPVLKFEHSEWPQGVKRSLCQFADNESCSWFLVPKPYKKLNGNLEPKDQDVPRLWRLHFPEVEKSIMHDKMCLKPVIKLVKLLRDRESWPGLASYYLKTIGIQMVIEHPEANYWKEDSMGDRFIEFLEKLQDTVKKCHLSYLFCPDFNLIRQLAKGECLKIQNKLEKIITTLKNDPGKVPVIFHVQASERPQP